MKQRRRGRQDSLTKSNITIKGGVLDGGMKSGTVLKIGHVKNIVVESCTLKNVKNNHLVETAGVKGITFKKCTFDNQKLDENASVLSYEAIQLDILEVRHMSGYRCENLATENVVIEGCSFTNVPRGVGSHTAIQNVPLRNLKIRNNTFRNLSSVAVQGMEWRDCVIENNTISNTPRGIAYYEVLDNGMGTFSPAQISEEGNTKSSDKSSFCKIPDSNIIIRNNTISLDEKKDGYGGYERGAIIVSGTNITSSKNYSDGSGKIAKGDYAASGVLVSGNNIHTTGQGIRVVDGRNVTVTGNKITFAAKIKDAGLVNYYGIHVTMGGSGNRITKNEVSDSASNGIYVNKDAQVSEIAENVVRNAGKYGIGIETSKVSAIKSNRITKTVYYGIFVFRNGQVTDVTGNTIADTGDAGIEVLENSTVGNLARNSISHPGSYGIVFRNKSKGNQVTGNKVTGTTRAAVNISSDSSAKVK